MSKIEKRQHAELGLDNIQSISELCTETISFSSAAENSGGYNSIRTCNKEEEKIIRISKLPVIEITTYNESDKKEWNYSTYDGIAIQYIINTIKIWNKANEAKLTPPVYFNGYIEKNNKPGKIYLHYAIVTEKYDHDLHKYYKMKNVSKENSTEDEEDFEVANTLIHLFSKMYEEVKVICFDIKPKNTVINMENGKIKKLDDGTLDIRLIDWDGDFCLTGKKDNFAYNYYNYKKEHILYLNVLLMGNHFIYYIKRHIFKEFYIENKEKLYECKCDLMDIFITEDKYYAVVENYFRGKLDNRIYEAYYDIFVEYSRSERFKRALFESLYYSMKLYLHDIPTYKKSFQYNNYDDGELSTMEPIDIQMKIKVYRETRDMTKKKYVNVAIEQFKFCKKYEINKCIFKGTTIQRYLYKLFYIPNEIEYSPRFSIISRVLRNKTMSIRKRDDEKINDKLPAYFAYIGTKYQIEDIKKIFSKRFNGEPKEIDYQGKRLLLFKYFHCVEALCENEIETGAMSSSTLGGIKRLRNKNRITKKMKNKKK